MMVDQNESKPRLKIRKNLFLAVYDKLEARILNNFACDNKYMNDIELLTFKDDYVDTYNL
jgi:hypothetical protein